MWDTKASLAVRPTLGAGESLIWCGRPYPGLMLRSSDALAIPFSLLWSAYIVFWVMRGFSSGLSYCDLFVGLPLLATAFYLLVGRFVLDALARKNTFYGLTNQRIIVLVTLVGQYIRSINLSSVSSLEQSLWKDDRGTITIRSSQVSLSWRMPPGTLRLRLFLRIELEGIENCREVNAAIRKAESELTRTS